MPKRPIQIDFKFLLTHSLPCFFLLIFSIQVFTSVFTKDNLTLGKGSIVQTKPVHLSNNTYRLYYLCEPVSEIDIIKQPSSAFSSFAFNLMGFMIISVSPSPQNLLVNITQRSLNWAFFAVLNILGFASFYFHAALTTPAMYSDFAGILLALSIISGFSVHRWLPLINFWVGCSGILVIGLFTRLSMIFWRDYDTTTDTFLVLSIGTLVSEYSRYFLYRYKGERRKAGGGDDFVDLEKAGQESNMESACTLDKLDEKESKDHEDHEDHEGHEDIFWLNCVLATAIIASTSYVLVTESQEKQACAFHATGSFQVHEVFQVSVAFMVAFVYCFMASGRRE